MRLTCCRKGNLCCKGRLLTVVSCRNIKPLDSASKAPAAEVASSSCLKRTAKLADLLHSSKSGVADGKSRYMIRALIQPTMKTHLIPLAILASALMTALPANAQQWINQYGELCWFDTQMSPGARCRYTFFRGQSVYICCQRVSGF